MLKDADGQKESPKERAERIWRNNALRKKYKGQDADCSNRGSRHD
jgi:hypothetical protein